MQIKKSANKAQKKSAACFGALSAAKIFSA